MRRRHAVEIAGAVLIGFGLGAWFGSEQTLRRMRFYADPANREEIKKAWRNRKK